MLLHADNFSIYGLKAYMLNGVYAAIPTDGDLVADPDGISSGQVLNFQYNSVLRYVLPSLSAVVGVAERVWMNSLPTAPTNTQVCPAVAYDIGATPIACIRIDNTGRIYIHAGNGNDGVIGSTTNPVVTANGWYHIETRFEQGGAGGCKVEVRVEGIPVLALTGLTFANTNQIASVGILNINGPSTVFWYAKDFILWDTSGTYNTTFLGTCLVASLVPTSDAALNWTPSAGANGYSILDNIPPVDASYISAGTGQVGSAYQGNMSDLPSDVTSVKGIITYVRAAKTDGGDGSMQVGVVTSVGTTVNGSNRPITIAQTYWRDVFEQDPDTTAPWTPAAVNAAKIKINRTV